MKIFNRIQNVLLIIGIYPSKTLDKSQNFSWKSIYLIVHIAIISICAGIFLAFEAEIITDYSDSLYGFTTINFVAINITIMSWKTSVIYQLIENLENIINKRLENAKSKSIYEESNAKVDRWCKRIFRMTTGTIVVCMGPNLAYTLITYFTKGLEKEDYINFMYPVWFPFDWRTFPVGYLTGLMAEGVAFYYMMEATLCLAAILIGSCTFLHSICIDMKHDIDGLCEPSIQDENHTQVKKKVCDIIEFHLGAVECVKNLQEIYEFIYTDYFLWGILNIAASLLMLQMEWSSGSINVVVIVALSVKSFYVFGLIFLYCEIGEIVNTSFNDVCDAFDECEYHLLPVDIQRMLPILIMGFQTSQKLQAFGNYPCSRKTFKSLFTKSCSFFVVFRRV